ncbi:hypothetical protein DRW03_06255 [Corallococcus sp. H22C18031201]|nr:hypothetical protein DRW03_06255 [Corallococcus sp. H22C18031201]
MNIASLINSPKPPAPPRAPRRLQMARLQATVLAQGAVTSLRDQVMAFRFMRGVLTGAGLAAVK